MTADRNDRTPRFYDLYDLPMDSLGGACRSGKGRCPCPPPGQAPDPDQAARLSRSQIATASRSGPRRCSRHYGHRRCANPHRSRPPTPRSCSPRRILAELSAQVETLGEVVAEHFGRHPDAEVTASLPGLGPILAARVLGEFGDAPGRYADAKARKNYADTSPITRASGRKKVVMARYAHHPPR